MKITGCDVWTVVVPSRPGTVNSPEFGPATWDQVPKHIVRLRTGDGVYGLGETARGCSRAAVESAAAHLVDRDPLAIPLQALPLAPAAPEPPRPGRSYEGLAGAGQANPAYDAFEMALFDLVGRALGRPAHALLGGAVRQRVPADYWIGHATPTCGTQTTGAPVGRAASWLYRFHATMLGSPILDRQLKPAVSRGL